MSYENWKDKIGTFEVMDVRGKKRWTSSPIEGKGCRAEKRRRTAYHPDLRACPLYPVLALMGFEHHTEKVSGSEYHIWFYRVKKGE